VIELPLTPALSHKGRGSPERSLTSLLLPSAGEGWGEGEIKQKREAFVHV